MDHEDTYFTPEAVDEQIDRLGSDSPLVPPSSQNARLLQDLRALHQADQARLENIWDRLAVQAQHGERTEKSPIDIQYYQQRRLQDQQQSQPILTSAQKTPGRRLHLLLTQLIAAVIIGSLLIIPAWIGYQQTAAPNFNQAQQELASHSIYLSNDQGVMGVDASTGRGHWTYNIPDYALGLPVNPIVENGSIYAESQDSIYAIDARTGALRWSHTFQSQISPYPTNKSRPVLSQNAIYVSVVFMEVNKLDATTGKILQTYRPRLNTNIVSIAVEKNVLYAFGLFDMCALRLTDGKMLWYRQTNQSQVLGIPHVQNGVLYTLASS
nr:PQQ-like beta-propeller repeat protein [Ktedonobacteraceae bacterium]